MRPRILSTHFYPERPAWVARVEMIDRRGLSRPALFRRLVRSAGDYDALVLNGAVGPRQLYVDLLAACVIARRRRPPVVALTDAAWSSAGPLDRAASWLGVHALDGPHVHYCVRTSAELTLMPETWGLDPARVRFTPYAHTLTAAELAEPLVPGEGVFCGGNSFRDYPLLWDAVRGLDTPVTALTGMPPAAAPPPNVRVSPIAGHDAFVEAMRGAAILALPLEPGLRRAAGLDTYLSAMAFGKLVVVSDSPGARDYVEDGVTGLIVPAGDVGALRSALEWALDPANTEAVARIRARAHDVARERFSYDRYVESVLRVVDEALAERSTGASDAASRETS